LLERTLRVNSLYDFYQSLLTDKQREYMKLYYFDDLSLAEISEHTKVSRQAVYDTLKRTEKILETYEDNLSLCEKYEQRLAIIQEVEESYGDPNKIKELVSKLKDLG